MRGDTSSLPWGKSMPSHRAGRCSKRATEKSWRHTWENARARGSREERRLRLFFCSPLLLLLLFIFRSWDVDPIVSNNYTAGGHIQKRWFSSAAESWSPAASVECTDCPWVSVRFFFFFLFITHQMVWWCASHLVWVLAWLVISEMGEMTKGTTFPCGFISERAAGVCAAGVRTRDPFTWKDGDRLAMVALDIKDDKCWKIREDGKHPSSF